MAICFRCKVSDSKHETKMPSKRFEIVRGKKQEACEGFQGFDPKLLEVPEIQKQQVSIPVIQDV